MADQEPHSLASTFPNPPPFWRDFTPERIARIEDLRAAHAENAGDQGGDAATTTTVRLPDLPEDLANLEPPPEPADGRWRVFGDQYMLDDKLPTLEEQGITNLPATNTSNNDNKSAPSGGDDGAADTQDSKDIKYYDRAFELKKLTKSLLLNFLELAGVLSRNPAHAEAKAADLRTLFINVHHVLNEYRPHQARESAIEMMQDHLDRTRAETLAIRTQVDKARSVLEGLGSLGLTTAAAAAAGEDKLQKGGAGAAAGDGGDGGSVEAERQRLKRERERELWAAADVALA
ncbi:RNA polymerase II mediator complex protein (Med7) [Purpureocillium lilacinum]|uniref:Mediator of RNA polymerase II transcription subunit 7 n=1 Tax=Purpureocillium lilacinum TaxID=33203 RepID=A0A179HSX8_PURLI|nr:RNA polymerase II mediator complex protein (Med7) [Purpureocillium lilacinum]OAQ92520.1 RNA polymerase II mediator complex protein (Med7) [Purpureocillium lilacinum]GJN84292.1 mediator of RNA polymerase II transcription subunit 7 [Purpureocillium lilacinum]